MPIDLTNLAAFDMVTGTALPFVAYANNTVRAIESDGSTVWVGGNFSAINGTVRPGLAALDAQTGAVLGTFDVSNNGAVYGLGLGNGRLYAGGYFTNIEGVSQERVASLDPVTARKIMAVVMELVKGLKITMITASHDWAHVYKMDLRSLHQEAEVMENGNVYQSTFRD